MQALFKEIFLLKCEELEYGKGHVKIGKQIGSELSQDKNAERNGVAVVRKYIIKRLHWIRR